MPDRAHSALEQPSSPVAILIVLLRAALSELQQKIGAVLSGLKTTQDRAHSAPKQPQVPHNMYQDDDAMFFLDFMM